jgi:hypothetical protein
MGCASREARFWTKSVFHDTPEFRGYTPPMTPERVLAGLA